MKSFKSFIAGMLTMLMICGMGGTASATTGKVTKELEYKNISVTLDGEKLDLRDAKGSPVEPFKFDGTNYLPVRALAECLDLDVAWDGQTSTVLLTTPEEKTPTYITRTGSKYHKDPSCNGGTYWEVSLETAKGMGLTPCEKCIGD